MNNDDDADYTGDDDADNDHDYYDGDDFYDCNPFISESHCTRLISATGLIVSPNFRCT